MSWGVYNLLLILLIIVVAWVAAKVMLRRGDQTLSLPMPPIPANPDPYETAYLTEGTAVETMIAILAQRGYLQKCRHEEASVQASESYVSLQLNQQQQCWWGEEKSIQSASNNPGNDLSPAEREMFDWFSEPRTGYKVFWTGEPKRLLKPHFSECDKKLRNAGLLTQQNVKDSGNVIWAVASLVIAGLSVWGLLAWCENPEDKGNALFGILLLAGFGIGVLRWICTPPHLSAMGHNYLERLKGRYEKYKGSVLPDTSPIRPLLVALFGVGVLVGTKFEWIDELKSSSEPADD